MQSPEPEILTELANSQRLIARYGDRMKYVPEHGKFFIATNWRWQADTTNIVTSWQKEIARELWNLVPGASPGERPQVVKFCIESERKTKISGAVELAKSDQSIVISADKLDADPMLAGTPTGVIDLRTGLHRPAVSSDLITKSLAVDPAGGPCSLWLSFLDRIMASNANLIGYLQRIAGLCLTGIVTVQEFWILYGGGANGKSVFIDTLQGIWGDYGGIAANSLITVRSYEEHATEIWDTRGKRMIQASETEDGARLKTQIVKKFTGDTKLKGRGMRQDFSEWNRTFKLLLVTNNKPKITEPTNAMWRRIRLIAFTVTIPPEEQDPMLLEKLRAEWPQILQWCIEGCLAWQRDGMQPPAEVLEATKGYAVEQDLLADFVADRCVLGRCKVSRNDLFTLYLSWASQTGEKHPLNRNSFFERVRHISGVTDTKWRPLGCNDPVRGFSGIGIKAVADCVTDTPLSPHTRAHEETNGDSLPHMPQVPQGGNGEYERAENEAIYGGEA